MKLYESLEKLDDIVLNYDTDSFIHSWKPSLVEIELGDYLGQMTNELDEDDYIVEFISAGGKNYDYTTRKGKVECKVKGFSMNMRGQGTVKLSSHETKHSERNQKPFRRTKKYDGGST